MEPTTKEVNLRGAIDKCRNFDAKLKTAFASGDIRLLRCAWLLACPEERLPYRQKLEEREQNDESPLLRPDEAVELLERGDRSIGALTQCVPPPISPCALNRVTRAHTPLVIHTACPQPLVFPGRPGPGGRQAEGCPRGALNPHAHRGHLCRLRLAVPG